MDHIAASTPLAVSVSLTSAGVLQVVIVAEADPASIPLEDREDLHVKPDPDAMTNGHANGVDIKVLCQQHLVTTPSFP